MTDAATEHITTDEAFELLRTLRQLGWSASIQGADRQGVRVTLHRLGSRPIEAEGASVADVVPALVAEARRA